MNISGTVGILFTAIVFALGWMIGTNFGRRVGLA